jgi:hypothetical protein
LQVLISNSYIFNFDMKKFIIRLLLFIAPFFIVSYFADIFISTNLKKSNFFAEKEYATWNDIVDGKINSDILIYGSSRAWVHISPMIIEQKLHTQAYNLGIDGHSFLLQRLRHDMLLEKNKKPKLIIYSVDIFTLQNSKTFYNYQQFLPYMLWNSKIKEATIHWNVFSNLDYDLPLLRYYGQAPAILYATKMFLKPNGNPIERIRGYQGQDIPWDFTFDKAKQQMKSYKIVKDLNTIHQFERFINECKQKKIKLVFVYTPEYIEGQKFVENRKEVIDIYQDFSKKYNIPFYDYSNDSISYNKKYFYNAGHMNKTGSSLFTQKFIDVMKKDKLF